MVYDVTEIGVAMSDVLSEALLKPHNNNAAKIDVKYDVLPLSTWFTGFLDNAILLYNALRAESSCNKNNDRSTVSDLLILFQSFLKEFWLKGSQLH